MVKITIQFTLIQYKEDNLKEVILDFLKEFQIRNLESVLNELTKSTYIVNLRLTRANINFLTLIFWKFKF